MPDETQAPQTLHCDVRHLDLDYKYAKRCSPYCDPGKDYYCFVKNTRCPLITAFEQGLAKCTNSTLGEIEREEAEEARL